MRKTNSLYLKTQRLIAETQRDTERETHTKRDTNTEKDTHIETHTKSCFRG